MRKYIEIEDYIININYIDYFKYVELKDNDSHIMVKTNLNEIFRIKDPHGFMMYEIKKFIKNFEPFFDFEYHQDKYYESLKYEKQS